jgi:beta-hydroxylase
MIKILVLFLVNCFIFYFSIYFLKQNTPILEEFIYVITSFLNPILNYLSTIENKPIYHDLKLSSVSELEQNWKIIRDEAIEFKKFNTIEGDLFFEQDITDDKKWRRFYIKWCDVMDPIATKMPETYRMIKEQPNIRTAMISVLEPRAYIKPHTGPYKGCLRYHLGLNTPDSSSCFIRVENEHYSWKNGKGILFDDTYIHHVENNTDKYRVILFCDINRPMGLLGMLINFFFVKFLSPLTSNKN